MNEIFESIPSSQEIQNGINQDTQRAIADFVSRVNSVISKMNSPSANMQTKGGDYSMMTGFSGNKVKEEYRKKGWEIIYRNEQRDGDYIEIKMIQTTSYQATQDQSNSTGMYGDGVEPYN